VNDRNLNVKLEKFFSFDGLVGYLFWRIIESITGSKSIYGIEQLANWLEWPIVALEEWVRGMPNAYSYESYKIPKKGHRGFRIIDAPNRELKDLQSRVYHKLLKQLTFNKAATGFVPGKSIVDNALPHTKQEVVINLDLKDFFSNISSNRVYRCWRFLGWDVKSSIILTHICCYKKRLPQGAPTSPALSNLCNILLDVRLVEVAKKEMGQYTRYADDITFSFPKFDDRNRLILGKVSQILASEDYEIQKKKRIRIQRPHQRQITTGLIVNQRVNLPREMRRRIRAMENHLSKGTLSEKDLKRLNGYKGLLNMVNKRNTAYAKIASNPIGIDRISILFLAADPSDKSRLRLGQEFREITEQLRLAKQRDRFKLEQPQLSLRTKDVSGALLDTKPQIVHFSGHGKSDGSLCFENELGQAQIVSIDAVAALFEQFSTHVNCVILNACYSEIQAEAIAKSINYVIGMKKEIGDEAAIAFAIGFYQALGAGCSIEESYRLGCVQINLQGIPEYLTPILIKNKP
jgi:hypothetical protein